MTRKIAPLSDFLSSSTKWTSEGFIWTSLSDMTYNNRSMSGRAMMWEASLEGSSNEIERRAELARLHCWWRGDSPGRLPFPTKPHDANVFVPTAWWGTLRLWDMQGSSAVQHSARRLPLRTGKPQELADLCRVHYLVDNYMNWGYLQPICRKWRLPVVEGAKSGRFRK